MIKNRKRPDPKEYDSIEIDKITNGMITNRSNQVSGLASKRGKSINNKNIGDDVSITFGDEELSKEEDSKSDEEKGEGEIAENK